MLAVLARGLALLIGIWIPVSCIEQPGNYSAEDSPRFEPVPVIKPGGRRRRTPTSRPIAP